MAESELQELQREQQRHDERFHRDVYYLAYPRRMAHLVFHVAKYAGRAWPLAAQETPAAPVFKKILVDTFIVSLSACEILNLDLDSAIGGSSSDAKRPTVREWGKRIARQNQAEPRSWLDSTIPHLAMLAKAMESLDHIEPTDSRKLLTDGFVAILKATIAASWVLQLDLAAETRKRWQEIETKRVL